ncbi:MAG: transglutaminase-like domain-containing protein [Candidatus Shapirobacteria bacterium]|nr:transglutaminase-like domain-containing protein [Candidatus Shapirobacteria bacterium]
MFLSFLLAFFFVFNHSILANADFDVNQKTQYQINIKGDAQVNQEIELINNLSQVFPKEYQAIISSDNIQNIIATDSQGSIIQNIEQQDNQTIINLKFNDQNVGKNQKTIFKINYLIPNLAQKKGNIWELALPENKNNLGRQSFNTTIFIPPSFGSLSFSSTPPKTVISLNNQTEIYFNSNDNKNPKIFLIFGNYQLFDFKFKYFLENTDNKNNSFTITLPPETDSQKITYRSIEPNPENINIDPDGNYLATYNLDPFQKLNINVDGQAKIIHSNLNKTNINPKDYLKSDLYWETNDSNLVTIASKLNTPKDIYQYVVDTLSYKQQNIDTSTRQGALNSILDPINSLCTEFTDLFITLARIKGIPAREVQGFAYSNNIKIKPININTDVLHAWPQYYDHQKQAWISIDPTWGKTTNGIDFFSDLDQNHFAFVFHGLNSVNPPPAGAYKNNQNVKTINVEFAQNELKLDQVPLTIIHVKNNFYQTAKIKIHNPNYSKISQLKIIIKNLNFETIIDHLPPLSSVDIPIQGKSFLSSILPINYKLNIKLEYNNDTVNFQINDPTYWFKIIILIAFIATVIGFGGIIRNKLKKQK